jgi:formylglycine-generating enzyme required for sulfatase activity
MMRRLSLVLLALSFGCAGTSGTALDNTSNDRGLVVEVDPSENRIALVIGNSAYQHVGTLRNPVNDAVLMAKTAKTLGFELIGGQALTDLDRPGMEEAISKLGDRVKGTDGRLVTLFYYAGHAIQVDGENWLAPITAQLQNEEDVDFQMVKVETVLKRLSDRDDAVNIVVLDACRNNPFPAAKRSGSRGLAIVSTSPQGTLIAYSTAPGSTADDGDGNNSVYTAALAKALKTQGLSLIEVFQETRRRVKEQTKSRQKTWDLSSLTDTFYLIPPRTVEPSAPITNAPRPSHAGVPAAPGEWVLIKAGSFQMGSPRNEKGRDDDERQHKVTLSRDFWLHATEVTQSQWRKVMGNNPSLFSKCVDQCPVENVNWLDAAAYCNALSKSEGLPECYRLSGCIWTSRCEDECSTFVFLGGKQTRVCTQKTGIGMECDSVSFLGLDCRGYRLPTEAEWEYATRAGATEARHGPLSDIAWYDGNSDDRPHPVKGKRPNAWGLYDMLGNLWEWCHDWYGVYPTGEVTDPVGPKKGSLRVVRSGSWGFKAGTARAAGRYGNRPSTRDGAGGFRPARTSF